MNEFSPKNQKGETLKSMLRRPQTAKLLKEAMNSPIGSTSRAKAQKIFSIMGKLNSSYDGAGGPGMLYGQMSYGQMPAPEMDPVHIPTDNSKGMVIFHKIPKPKIVYGNKASKFQPRAGSFDGQGGPGSDLSYGERLFGNVGGIVNTFSKPFADYLNSPTASPQSTPSAPLVNTPAISSPYSPPATQYKSFNFGTPTTPIAPSATKSPSSYSNISIDPNKIAGTVGDKKYNPAGDFITPTTPTKNPFTASITNAQTSSMGSNYSGGASSDFSGGNIASSSVASILGVTPQTPLSSIQIADLAKAIAQNEGYSNGTSTIAITHNNPGNLKFVGQAGATQGDPASDGGHFAKFTNPQDGWNALQNDLQAKVSSGKYSTLSDLMTVYSPDSGNPSITSKYSGLSATAEDATKQNTGAGMFAINQLMDPNNPFTKGKTLEQLTAENQKSLWDKYNIGGLQKEETRLREEGAVLPKNVTAYITARDQYLTQTDKEIDRFIDDSMAHTDMSNPANATKANAQLNYLYTLRGRQNQSYIGYLNDAVEQHQAGLDHVSNLYNTALTTYETDLKNANSITAGQYNLYASALADMYTAVDGAPLKSLQMETYKQQMLDAHTTAIADAVKKTSQGGYLEQYAKLKGHIITNEGMAIPGLDLVKQIQDLGVLDSSISPENIIQAYTEGVNRYMNTPADGKDITSDGQKKLAEEAIKQFAQLTIAGADNPNTVILGQTSANDIAQRLATHMGNSIVGKGTAPQMMEAVKTLAPSGWFSSKTSPTVDDFVKTVTSKTKDPLDESLARAIYAVFSRYVEDGGSPASAVNAFLYPTSSTSDRTNPQALTPEEFARNIGTIYASDIINQAFASQ